MGAVVQRLSEHCDVGERVRLVPPSAQLRGLYFRSVEDILQKNGLFQAFCSELGIRPDQRMSALRLYPASDYLVWLALAASMLEGPKHVQKGLYRVGYEYSSAFTESILGRTLLRVLSRDPYRVAQQGLAGRRQSATFGTWGLERLDARHMLMTYDEEYVWVDSVIAGAAKGTFDACGMTITLETRLTGMFSGETYVTW